MGNNYEYRALGSYKQELINSILNIGENPLCELLIDLLMPSVTDNRFDKIDNFIGGEFDYIEDGEKILVKLPEHIFDVPFIYSTVTDTRNVICIDDDIANCNNSIKKMSITIYVVCSKRNLQLTREEMRKYTKLGYVGRNRLDVATAILGDILNRSDVKAIGKLEPNPYAPTKSYFPDTKNEFFGKILSYNASDFMVNYGERLVNCR